MNKDEIKTEIEKARKHLEALEKKLAQKHSLGDASIKKLINVAANNLSNQIRNAGLKEISVAFGEVTNWGDYANRSIFLSSLFFCSKNGWKWKIIDDTEHDQQVLVRVDNVTGECID